MKKEPKHIRYLKSINACGDSITFASNYKTIQETWDACERPDWLFWLLGKQARGVGSDSRNRIVFAAAQCARTALKYTKDPRVLSCILTVEGYTRGENTIEEVRTARADAAAAYAAAYADAADAAYAAAYAYAAAAAAAAADADAAYAAAAAAADAAYAAAAAAAAAYAAADAARQACLKNCAKIIKDLFPIIRMGRWVEGPHYVEKKKEQE